jgi:class 3 adenylate cyclase
MTELPSGAVTFLFSDIEGSTRLVKALRERYAEVLAEHRRPVRAAIADQAGHEIDTQGDAFSGKAASVAVFDSSQQAVPVYTGPETPSIYLPTASGLSAGHFGYELPTGVNLDDLASQIIASMRSGHDQTVTLNGGGALVLNGARLSFVFLCQQAPPSVGGPVPHDN